MNLKNWYFSQFPESLFPCNINLLKEYQKRILIGANIVEQANVAIVAIYTEKQSLNNNTIARIECLSRIFNSCDIFIYEEPFLKKQYDYTIILDTNAIGGYSYEGILNSFGWSEVWDGIGSNGVVLKYHNNIWKRQFDDRYYCKLGTWNEDVYNKYLVYERGEPPIRCFSSFGGLIIYKNFNQDSLDILNINKKIVENGGTIWLNPSMITLYGETEYSRILN